MLKKAKQKLGQWYQEMREGKGTDCKSDMGKLLGLVKIFYIFIMVLVIHLPNL